jgi:hypothetical protein
MSTTWRLATVAGEPILTAFMFQFLCELRRRVRRRGEMLAKEYRKLAQRVVGRA